MGESVLEWPLRHGSNGLFFQVTDQFAAWLIDLLVAVDCRSDCPNESFDWSEMKIYNTWQSKVIMVMKSIQWLPIGINDSWWTTSDSGTVRGAIRADVRPRLILTVCCCILNKFIQKRMYFIFIKSSKFIYIHDLDFIWNFILEKS